MLIRIVGATVVLAAGLVRGDVISAPDYKIKAGFIYNFAKLTQWPAEAFESESSPIKIGVVGSDVLADYLVKEVEGRTIHGRKLTITRFKPSLLVTNCHILFISDSADDQIEQIPSAVLNRPILTVGDSPRFLASGGIIQLVRKNASLQFLVKRSGAERAKLTFSSKLLALAQNAREEKDK